MNHPLDRPVWSALNTGWRDLALGDGRALQLDPAYGPFAATENASPTDLGALSAFKVGVDGLWLQEMEPLSAPPPAGLVVERSALVTQMVAETVTPGEAVFQIVSLGEDDAPAMQALAALTRPGPFAERTHQLSPFIGVKKDGRLVAMAGERMQLDAFAEVSGVCTDPDHRGQGYAAGLMRVVARRILARGQTPFLHAYAANTGAIRLYETLGFRAWRDTVVTVLRRA